MRHGTCVSMAVTTMLVTAAAGCSRSDERAGAPSSSASSASRTPRAYRDWPGYGGGPEGIRYSALDQINRQNVTQLQVAWTYDSGETGGLQTNPVVIGDVVYVNTPSHKVVALDGATGAVRWRFDAGVKSSGANRGVMYWADDGAGAGAAGTAGAAGAARATGATGATGAAGEARIFAAVDRFVYAIDAKTGALIPTFGQGGRIDLHEHLGRPAGQQSVKLTTPGAVYKDLLILGGRVSEGLPASPGDVRAFDARTGALRWAFHTIPHPGEAGYETWPKDAWTYSGGANNWAGMAIDQARGVVYVPTGSAAADFYGANRPGDNLYANSLIALDAATGKRLWHFQAVRHDIWDRDFPSQPSLVTVTHGGRRIDAVAQPSKQGVLFLFDRTDGRPLFPIEERSYPTSTVDGEVTAARQPMPTKPAPFARQRLTQDLLTTRTPEANRAARKAFRALNGGDPFVPFRVGQETIIFPGFDGGAEWGGSAFDPESGLFYVNANEMAWTGSLAPNEAGAGARPLYRRTCASCHRDDFKGAPPQIPSIVDVANRRSSSELERIIRQGTGRMPGFPALSDEAIDALVEYMRTGLDRRIDHDAPTPAMLKYRFGGYKKFLDADGYPAIAPPWGTLTAIDLHTGEHAWQVPLGEYPELVAKGLKNTGTESYGGPIVTAGGLLFIAATCFDQKFRAFDKTTGALLWQTTLPFTGTGTPATYEVGGRQFIVVPAAGGRGRDDAPTGGKYVAFALPATRP